MRLSASLADRIGVSFLVGLLTATHGLAADPATAPRAPRAPTFDDRVAAESAIERVLYEKRIWPKENGTPKPPFEAAVRRSDLAQKVRDGLAESAALGRFWNRPLRAEQLQAEIDRMVRGSRDSRGLSDLFSALRNDPTLVAECLARPILAGRLARRWYAFDPRFHAATRAEAESTLRGARSLGLGNASGGRFETVRLVDESRSPLTAGAPDGTLRRLSASDFDAESSKFPERPGEVTIEETADAFLLRATVALSAGELRGQVRILRKTPFDEWFGTVKAELASPPNVPASAYVLPQATLDQSFRPDTWSKEPSVPAARNSHAAVWTGAEMVVWGGQDGSGVPLGTGGRYDPATDTWRETTTSGAPEGRTRFTFVWSGSELIVWGGLSAGVALSSGGRYDPTHDRWSPTSVCACPVPARFDATAVWTGNQMIVWGGFASGAYLDSGARYTPATDTWLLTSTTSAPPRRAGHVAIWTGVDMLVWGGYGCTNAPTCSTNGYLQTGGRYNPGTATWTPITTTAAPTARLLPSAVWTGTDLIVWGGETGFSATTNTGGRYNPDLNSWSATFTGVGCPTARKNHTAVWTGAEMIVFGGDNVASSGGRYRPASNTWGSISGSSSTTLRTLHSAVWTGSEMIVWGGNNAVGGTTLDTGARYSPAFDDWIRTSQSNAPSPAQLASAVFTGAEVIVFGGFVGSSFTDVGARYSPASDSWSHTRTGTVSARQSHVAAWTGSRMIVWGGYGCSDPPTCASTADLSTGGLYDPATNLWTATSAAAAPDARHDATGVWTGSELIVWGGESSMSPSLDTGGRYEPVSNGWTPTTTVGAPAARTGHSAVWTGAEMILFGGRGGAGVLGDGARYGVSPESWTPLPAAGAPGGRRLHTAVWAGDRMVVWGGSSQPSFPEMALGDGATYEPPPADAWSAVPTTNAPSARYSHSAVWTGTEMLLFGGVDSGFSLQGDGARLDPGKPEASAWSALPMPNAPSPRDSHTATWTGAEMVVWGGSGKGELGVFAPDTPPVSLPKTRIDGVDGGTITLGAPAETLELGQDAGTAWWDDVEGPPQWTATGSWHLTYGGTCSGSGDYSSPATAWSSGAASGCTYAGPAGVSTLDSIPTFPVTSNAVVTFRYFLETDPSGSYETKSTPISISYGPDGATSRIQVPAGGPIADLDVRVTLSHPNDGDLLLYLIGPNGTRITLANGQGGSGDDFRNTKFDDEAAMAISGGSAPFAGTYQPEEPLSIFDGLSSAGNWTLQVIDFTTADSGTIDSWGITFNSAAAGADGDSARVEIDDGSGFVPVAVDASHWGGALDGVRLEDASTSWRSATIRLADRFAIGTPVRVRFAFEHDGVRNGAPGWIVDDIGIGEPSGDGSNPGAAVPFHDQWDKPKFQWFLGGPADTGADNPDATTPDWSIPEAELGAHGLGEPGVHTLRLRVTDRSGASTEATVDVTVVDATPPTVTVGTPNGGESLVQGSPAAITWSGSDNIGIDHWEVSYSSTGAGGPWTSIDASVPAVQTYVIWNVPPSLSTSAARIRVVAVDTFGNAAEDVSDGDFYVVQSTTDAVRTIVLFHQPRFEALYPGEGAALASKVAELAANPKVRGVVRLLDGIPAIAAAYSAWEASPTSPAAANAVTTAIHQYLYGAAGQVSTVYTEARYLVLVGDDRLIPFRRMSDFTSIFSENTYSGADPSTTVGSAIANNKYLTDDYLADFAGDATGAGNGVLYLPDLSVGRLVESPAEITKTINGFISQDGQISLFSPQRVFVSGRDFFTDSATAIRDLYSGSPNLLADSLLDSENPAWTAADLRGQLFQNPHALYAISGHADHFSLDASDGYLTTTTLEADPDVIGAVAYAVGCHSGLTQPPGAAEPLDLPQSFLRHGFQAYVGNTGYGWGLKPGIGYSERLLIEATRAVVESSSIALGDAISRAKRSYYLSDHRYDVFDEKILMEWTLFGLPMYQVVVANPSTPAPRASAGDPADDGIVSGIRIEKRLVTDDESRSVAGAASLPPGVVELDLAFTFLDPASPLGSPYRLVSTPDGQYYDLNREANGETDEPIQPRFLYDSRLSGTKIHGTLFTGGNFREVTGFTPAIAVPVSNNTDSTPSPAPKFGAYIPTVTSTYTGLQAPSCETTDLSYSELSVTTGEYRGGGVERLFNSMSFVSYYSNHCDVTPPVITDPGSSAHTLDGLTAHFSVSVADVDASIYRVVITSTDDRLDASAFPNGSWSTLDLEPTGGTNAPGQVSTWTGSLTISRNVRYLIQAVDSHGNVAPLVETGSDVNAVGTPYGSTYRSWKILAVTLADVDADGLPDAWEQQYFGGLAQGAGSDPDSDGLTNARELDLATRPDRQDTDGDGDNDGSEASHAHDPLVAGDGHDIAIVLTASGSDVVVSWSADAANASGPFYVYRGTTPFFSPSSLLGTIPLGNPATTWTDAGAIPGPTYYYRVTNVAITTPPPAVQAVAPGTGPQAGGTSVSIYGDDFVSGGSVSIGGAACTSVVFVNPSRITCTVPPRVGAGSVAVTVTSPNGQFGTLPNGFTYY